MSQKEKEKLSRKYRMLDLHNFNHKDKQTFSQVFIELFTVPKETDMSRNRTLFAWQNIMKLHISPQKSCMFQFLFWKGQAIRAH